MPQWSTACIDWADRLVKRKSIIPPPIFPDEAERALDIFKSLRVTDLPGKPTFGECADQTTFDFVAAIFGAYDAETGRQLIREFYYLVAKKNAKSMTAAGIMVTAVILCWRDEEEHLILAPTKEIADNSFRPAAAMIRADPELVDLFHIQDHSRTITHRVSNSSLKVVAADTDTVSGKKAGRVLIDEHWLFGKQANADAMFMEATGGQISREEGWVIYLTTQSQSPPAGVFKEKLAYFRAVRDGVIHDPKSLPVLFEFPAEMVKSKAYLDPRNFYIANPNIGRSVSAEWLEDQLKKIAGATDGSLQKFLSKHLNIEIGLGLLSNTWVGALYWQACAEKGLSLKSLIERCEVLTAGIDGGGLDDMLGLCILGRETLTGRWLHWARAWIHPIVLDRHKAEADRFRDFEKQGDLVIVEKIGDDIQGVVDVIAECEESGLLDDIGVDPSGIGAIVDALLAIGIPMERIKGISQGWKMVGAIKTAERRLADGTWAHGGADLMNWVVGNAKVEPRGNAIIITKATAGNAKIDPLMASLDAVSLMQMNPPSKKITGDSLFFV